MKRIRTIFGRIAELGFHTYTVKGIWAIFGGIAGQGFHTFTMKRIWTILGGYQTGFPLFCNEMNLDYFWEDGRTGFPHML
jgi:hypothetical protein